METLKKSDKLQALRAVSVNQMITNHSLWLFCIKIMDIFIPEDE